MMKRTFLIGLFLTLVIQSQAQLKSLYSDWNTINYYVGWHMFSEKTMEVTNEYPQGIDQTIAGWSIWLEFSRYDITLLGLSCRWEYKNELIENVWMWSTGKLLKIQPGSFQEYGGDIGSVVGAAGGMGHFGFNVIDNRDIIYAVGPSLGDFSVSHLSSEQSAIGRYHVGAGVFNQVDYALSAKSGIRGTLVVNKALNSFEIPEGKAKPWLMLSGIEYFQGRLFARAEWVKLLSEDQVGHSALRLKIGFR